MPGGDAATKDGDDYALRIYIIFPYDPAEASFGTKLKYNAAKLIYGEYPPLAIMSDTDNTGERATAYIDYIRVRRE